MKQPVPSPSRKKPGFTLIITLVMMVLLTTLGLGLLSLSTITLRASSQGSAITVAKNNARLALMMAIGDLQKAAGPDQRVTASASIINESASPGITGVWESWKASAAGGNDYDSRKKMPQSKWEVADGEFVTWLASGPVASLPTPDVIPGQPSPTSDAVTLVSERTNLGVTAKGTFLTPTSVGTKGAMAWTVLDEGVKARIDLPTEANPADSDRRISRLRSPGRSAIESISDQTVGLRMPPEIAPKVVSLNEGELQTANPKSLRPYIHDLTPYSTTLPINVADGGIRGDLTRAFENSNLPSDMNGRYVYSNSKTKLWNSDPLFSNLAAYYQLYKTNSNPTTPLQIKLPTRYTPANADGTPNPAPLAGTLIAPVITRVQVAFSLISRVAHGNWPTSILNATGDNQRNRMVYLVYTPVVTVYNPYSAPLQFNNLKVTFRNLPVAFTFYRNGVAQSNKPALLSQFHLSAAADSTDTFDDPFSCTLSSTPGTTSNSPITLYPGEAKVFGVNRPATDTWSKMANFLWQNDLGNSQTKSVASGPGWDYRCGYMVDWLRPSASGRTDDNKNLGVFAARPTDTINVGVSPAVPGSSNGKFTMEIEASAAGTNSPTGIYEYKYGDLTQLTNLLQNGNHSTIGKITYPFKREKDWAVPEMTIPNPDSSTIAQWGSIPQQFAVFTLGTRTANDSLYPGKPGRTSSFVHQVLQMDATRNHPATLPMEMSLLPVTTSGANTVGSIDADDANRAFYFSGTSRNTGLIQYVSQQIPTSPLVNLADLRHANLASSGFLPLTAYTVGESLASPLVVANKGSSSNTGLGYEVLDHAWLANQTLWDSYFFSGLRDQSDATLLFNNGQLPLNPRLTSMLPAGQTASAASAKALSSEAWADLAALVALKGGFNVNSTSKSAWKAILCSLRGLQIPVLGPVEIRDPAVPPASYTEILKTSSNAPFPRLSRPIGDFVDKTNSQDNQRRWSGYRDLSEAELDALVEKIVQEVRLRGPFLTLGEFVNRRLVDATNDFSTAGALEAAIRNAKLNEIPGGPFSRTITEAEAASFGFANPKAAAGNTEEGASAHLSQGDILSAIGASITVRSDTFVIRSYGDARDENNKIISTAWCEAVVQRVPTFVDPLDKPEKVQAAVLTNNRKIADLSSINQRFGRRFEIISFRWLNRDEV